MSTTTKLAQMRAEIARLDAHIAALMDGGTRVPIEMARERAAAMVEAHALRTAEKMQSFAGQFAAPDYVMPAPPEVSAWGLAVLLHPQALGQSLADLISHHYPAGIDAATPDEIAKRLSVLRKERAAIERDEFALADKLGVPQRADIDPRLILGLGSED